MEGEKTGLRPAKQIPGSIRRDARFAQWALKSLHGASLRRHLGDSGKLPALAGQGWKDRLSLPSLLWPRHGCWQELRMIEEIRRPAPGKAALAGFLWGYFMGFIDFRHE